MHIGSKIRDVLMQQSREHTVTWLSKKLNCHRVNVYDIFNRSTIDTELLRRISLVLGHDFFQDLSDDLKSLGLDDKTSDSSV
ncbi:MAG: hypothetical protein NC082_03630 [Clostridiales bacterium]|nr:hypothetical protein [Clostridiales bacterium]